MFTRVVPVANRIGNRFGGGDVVQMNIKMDDLPDTWDGKKVDEKIKQKWIIEGKSKLKQKKKEEAKLIRKKKRIRKKHERRNPTWPNNCYGRLQKATHYAFDPSTTSGRILNGIVILLVFISVMTFMIETMPEFYSNEPTKNYWFWIETGIVIVFTIELGLRFWASPFKIDFCKNWLNIVDFLAVAPYYFELVMQSGVAGFQVIRIVRLARVVRLFKLARFTAIVAVLKRGMIAGKEGLYLMIFFLFLSLILFASIMYYAENSEAEWFNEDDIDEIDDDGFQQAVDDAGDYCEFGCWVYDEKRGHAISPYQSIPASLWWAIVTQTTVGYGDIFPITPVGKFVAACSYVFAIVMMAYPVAILGEAFLEEYLEYNGKTAKVVKRKKASLLPMNDEAQIQKLVDDLLWQTTLSCAALNNVVDSVDRLVRSFLLFTPGKYTMTQEIFEALKETQDITNESLAHIDLKRDRIDDDDVSSSSSSSSSSDNDQGSNINNGDD